MPIHPNDIPEKDPGDFLTAEEVNGLIKASRDNQSLPVGHTGYDGVNVHFPKRESDHRWEQVINNDFGDIPAFSVFTLGLSSQDQSDEQVSCAPVQQLPTGTFLRTMTNGPVVLRDGDKGWAKSIDHWTPQLVRTEPGILIGHHCGLGIAQFTVSPERMGLVAVSNRFTDGKQWVVASGYPRGMVCQLTTTLSAADLGAGTLGVGTAKMYYRNDGASTIALAADPDPGTTPNLFTIFNRCELSVDNGTIIHAVECVGIGLVYIPCDEPGTICDTPPYEFFGLSGCIDFDGCELTFRLQKNVWDGNCLTEETADECSYDETTSESTIVIDICDPNPCEQSEQICVSDLDDDDGAEAYLNGTYTRDSEGLYFQDGGTGVIQLVPDATNRSYCQWELVDSQSIMYRTNTQQKVDGCVPNAEDGSWSWFIVSGTLAVPTIDAGACA